MKFTIYFVVIFLNLLHLNLFLCVTNHNEYNAMSCNYNYDPIVLKLPFMYTIDNEFNEKINITVTFSLLYSQINNWKGIVEEFSNNLGINRVPIDNYIRTSLISLGFSEHIINGNIVEKSFLSNELLTSQFTSNKLLQTSKINFESTNLMNDSNKERTMFLIGDGRRNIFYDSGNPNIDIINFNNDSKLSKVSLLPKNIIEREIQQIIVYQTRGVSTGGTTALNSLFLQIQGGI